MRGAKPKSHRQVRARGVDVSTDIVSASVFPLAELGPVVYQVARGGSNVARLKAYLRGCDIGI